MKKTIRENPRLEIIPWSRYGGQDLERDVTYLKRDIVDTIRTRDESQIENLLDTLKDAHIEIVYDEKEVCEFCGSEWEVQETDDDPDCPEGQPLCCQKAVEEFEANQKKE